MPGILAGGGSESLPPSVKPVAVGSRVEGGRTKSDFFVAVRQRGLMNSMLDTPSKAYEAAHPGMRCKWEFAPAGGDNSFVVAREAMGFKLVDANELGESTASQQKTGPVRRGDLVLMAAPEAIVEEIELADAQAAEDDQKLSETTYREHIESVEVQTRGGEVVRGKAIGHVRRHVESQPVIGGGE